MIVSLEDSGARTAGFGMQQRRFGGPFEKPCGREGCDGVIVEQQWCKFERREYCSADCSRQVNIEKASLGRRLAAAAARKPELEAAAYRAGYTAGYQTATYRWRTWLRRQRRSEES